MLPALQTVLLPLSLPSDSPRLSRAPWRSCSTLPGRVMEAVAVFDHSCASFLIFSGNDVLPALVPWHQLPHVPQWLTDGVEVGMDCPEALDLGQGYSQVGRVPSSPKHSCCSSPEVRFHPYLFTVHSYLTPTETPPQ